MRIVFFGSKESSVTFLRELQKKEEVAGVVTAPDSPSGRGLKMHSSPVKVFAEENKISVFHPASLKDPKFITWLLKLKPDLGVVVAYGKILPEEIFSIPGHGMINVHFSLLPEYRGAAPIQWALINGEKTTGITIFFIDDKLDTGKIIIQKEFAIEEGEDMAGLEERLSFSGAGLLVDSLEIIKNKTLSPCVQKGAASYAPSLKKSDGQVKWRERDATEVINLMRGTKPWPGTFTVLYVNKEQKNLKILKARAMEKFPDSTVRECGEVVAIVKGEGIVVKCKKGFLVLQEVQPENSKPMPAWNFWQGARLKIGDKFI